MQNNAIRSLFIFCLATSTSAWGEGMVYKCKNQEGTLIYQKSPCNQGTDTINSWSRLKTSKAPEPESEAGLNNKAKNQPTPVLTLKQNANGHYSTEASINDKSLNFVVDTGASIVSLPEAIAHSALIYCDDKIGVMTANGATEACTAKIKKLVFGPFVIKDIAAAIVPNLSQPLLGMNVLDAFKIAQENGEMRISIDEKKQAN